MNVCILVRQVALRRQARVRWGSGLAPRACSLARPDPRLLGGAAPLYRLGAGTALNCGAILALVNVSDTRHGAYLFYGVTPLSSRSSRTSRLRRRARGGAGASGERSRSCRLPGGGSVAAPGGRITCAYYPQLYTPGWLPLFQTAVHMPAFPFGLSTDMALAMPPFAPTPQARSMLHAPVSPEGVGDGPADAVPTAAVPASAITAATPTSPTSRTNLRFTMNLLRPWNHVLRRRSPRLTRFERTARPRSR